MTDTDSIMALVGKLLRVCTSQDAVGSDMDKAEVNLRAAVERVIAERDGRRPMSSVEGMVQRSRAERAEAERDQQRAAIRTAVDALTDCEAERDALKGLLVEIRENCIIGKERSARIDEALK